MFSCLYEHSAGKKKKQVAVKSDSVVVTLGWMALEDLSEHIT